MYNFLKKCDTININPIFRLVGENVTYSCPGVKVGQISGKASFTASCREGRPPLQPPVVNVGLLYSLLP